MRSFLKVAVLAAGVLGAAAFAAPTTPPPTVDPPAELGEAYVIEGVTVTPVDGPFDDVGVAAMDGSASSISMAHRTLPLPSYAEVTALDSGRTILVRVERRGPLSGLAFVSLSSGAIAQLEADPAQPLGVRVRRVSPQEYEKSLLRTAQRAPERLATPKPLLEVLRRRLAAKATPPPSIPAASNMPVTPATVVDKPSPAIAKAPTAKPSTTKSSAAYAVQVAAFANRAGADIVAKKLGGAVSSAGKLWRVRIGPFESQRQAAAAQAKARRAGFADAQIVATQGDSAK